MVDVIGVIVVVHAREDFAKPNFSVVKQLVSKADAANGVVIGFTGIRDGIIGDFRTVAHGIIPFAVIVGAHLGSLLPLLNGGADSCPVAVFALLHVELKVPAVPDYVRVTLEENIRFIPVDLLHVLNVRRGVIPTFRTGAARVIAGDVLFAVARHTSDGVANTLAGTVQIAVIPQVAARVAELSPSTSVVLIEHPVSCSATHLVPAESDGLSSLVERLDVDMGRRTAPTRAHTAVHESSFQKIKAEVALCRSIKLFGFLNHMYHQHLSELFFTASLRRPAVGQGSRTSHPHRT